VLVDGVYGGLTPSGLMHVAVFNERQPIPEQATYVLNENGIERERLDLRQSKQGFVREVEANLMMSVETAELLRDWLTTNIAVLRKALKDADRG